MTSAKPSGLVMHLKMNGHGGIVPDLSGSDNHGFLGTGAAQPTRLANDQLSYDGVANVTEVSDNASLRLTDMTITIWIKPLTDYDGTADRNTFIESLNWNYKIYNQYSNTRLLIRDSGNSDHICTSSPSWFPPLNQWSYIVGTYDGADMRLYADGTQIGVESAVFTPKTVASNILLAEEDTTSLFWNGVIDEARIYNRAIPLSEIQALYAEGVTRLGL